MSKMKYILSTLIILLSGCTNPKEFADTTRSEDEKYLYVISNGIPTHAHGNFPNRRNPNAILKQKHYFRIPKLQTPSHKPIMVGHNRFFGVSVHGIPFDPATNEFWRNNRSSGWNYEAMSRNVDLGLDNNNAHVNPLGVYHYHGVPYPVYLGDHDPNYHSPLVGYAADGYPIYALYGYTDPQNRRSAVKKVRSSFRVINNVRSSGPGGQHDGTFVEDHQYIPLLGDLDQCNGRFGITPEYPEGTYHYFLTDVFPFIPRCFRGKPDESFYKNQRIKPHSRLRPFRQPRPFGRFAP